MQRRSEPRVESGDEVRIKGADARGVNFDERARTVNMSAHGLALLTPRDLAHAATLTVSIRGRGESRRIGGRADFLAQAMVTYVFPDGDLNRVGLQFIGTTLAIQA